MLVWARRRCGGGALRSSREVWRIDVGAGRLGSRTWTFCLELGIGIAIGMLAGTTGTHGSARGRMTLLAAVIGLVVGFLLAGRRLDGCSAPCSACAGAVFGCLVISDVVCGASRREGSGGGALGFLVALAALIVVAVAPLLVPVADPRS